MDTLGILVDRLIELLHRRGHLLGLGRLLLGTGRHLLAGRADLPGRRGRRLGDLPHLHDHPAQILDGTVEPSEQAPNLVVPVRVELHREIPIGKPVHGPHHRLDALLQVGPLPFGVVPGLFGLLRGLSGLLFFCRRIVQGLPVLVDHLIEGLRELSHLILGLNRYGDIQGASRHFPGGVSECHDRPRERADKQERYTARQDQ